MSLTVNDSVSEMTSLKNIIIHIGGLIIVMGHFDLVLFKCYVMQMGGANFSGE